MKLTKLHDVWNAGKPVVNGWCSIPSTVTAEMMSLNDFDSLTIDLQHGLVDYQTALSMLQAMNASGITPLARVPWNEPGIIMKLLDAGALGIICPMVNTPQEAEQFVATMRYAPNGVRSSGPTRAAMVHGANYHFEADDALVSLAMVETVEALENVEKIATTDGLTGIYIGPSDLAVSMGYAPGLDRNEDDVDAAIGRILAACKSARIKSAIHCLSPHYLKSTFDRGFDLATLATDIRLFDMSIKMQMQIARS